MRKSRILFRFTGCSRPATVLLPADSEIEFNVRERRVQVTMTDLANGNRICVPAEDLLNCAIAGKTGAQLT